jgi:hypothetical protein
MSSDTAAAGAEAGIAPYRGELAAAPPCRLHEVAETLSALAR